MVGVGKSGYRNWTKKLSRLTKLDRLARFVGPRVEIIGTRDWKSGVLAKDLLGNQEST